MIFSNQATTTSLLFDTLRVWHYFYFLYCLADFLSTFRFGEVFFVPNPSVFLGPPQPRKKKSHTLCLVVLRYFDRSSIFVKGQCTHCGVCRCAIRRFGRSWMTKNPKDTCEGTQRIQRTPRKLSRKKET